MLGVDMSNVTAAGGNWPGAGGYVIRIQKATVRPQKQDLEIEFDIIEGDYAKVYLDFYSRKKYWPGFGKLYKSYKEKAMPFLKSWIELIMECNTNTEALLIETEDGKLDVDETKLTGKMIGIVYGMEEYISNDGQVKTRPDYFGATFVSPEKIRNGEYTVPDLKKLDNGPAVGGVVDTTASGFGPIRDDDLPFC